MFWEKNKMAKADFTDHIRQGIIDVIVALRQRKTPNALTLAQSTEEILNGIPEQAATFAKERGDGHPVLFGSRLIRLTPGIAYLTYMTLMTLELTTQLNATLQKDLELTDLTRVPNRPWTPDTDSAPGLTLN